MYSRPLVFHPAVASCLAHSLIGGIFTTSLVYRRSLALQLSPLSHVKVLSAHATGILASLPANCLLLLRLLTVAFSRPSLMPFVPSCFFRDDMQSYEWYLCV